MSFKPDIANLKNQYDVLKQQSYSTMENWNDPVQRKFYDQFINTLPNEVMAFLNALNKLDSLFENAEQKINELHS